MKMKFVIILCIATIMLSGCTKEKENSISELEESLVQDEFEMQDDIEDEIAFDEEKTKKIFIWYESPGLKPVYKPINP